VRRPRAGSDHENAAWMHGAIERGDGTHFALNHRHAHHTPSLALKKARPGLHSGARDGLGKLARVHLRCGPRGRAAHPLHMHAIAQPARAVRRPSRCVLTLLGAAFVRTSSAVAKVDGKGLQGSEVVARGAV